MTHVLESEALHSGFADIELAQQMLSYEGAKLPISRYIRLD